MADVSATRLAELAAYCRMDKLSPDDELLLTQAYLSAEAYMDAAGVREPADFGWKAADDLCVNYLVYGKPELPPAAEPAESERVGARFGHRRIRRRLCTLTPGS